MTGRLPYVAILGGSVGFVVSLYFKWTASTSAACAAQGQRGGVDSLLCLLSSSGQLDGWDFFGQVAAALALTLAGVALAALVRPQLVSGFPVGKTTLALGIFSLLSVATVWQVAVARFSQNGVAFELAPAAYAGLAAAGVVCAAAAVRHWETIAFPSRATAAGQLLSLGLLASFFLQAFNAHATVVGSSWPALLVCALACLSLWAWPQSGRPELRLVIAAAIATLVAGYLIPIRQFSAQWPYELWLLLACAAALLALAILEARDLYIQRPDSTGAAVLTASVLVLVSLFLPWTSVCAPSLGCSSVSGWYESWVAAGCVLVLLVGSVWLRRLSGELAIATAMVVAAAGSGGHLRYGAFLGFAGAAVLLLAALRPLRPVRAGQLSRLIPELGALAILALNAAPLFSSSATFAVDSPWRWLVVLSTMVLVATLRLLIRWCTSPGDSTEVVLLPLALLAATALDLIYIGTVGGRISWEAWLSVLVCLVLVWCGWAERFGGAFRIPEEIWRVDRLPAVED